MRGLGDILQKGHGACSVTVHRQIQGGSDPPKKKYLKFI
jgi:hypothetical protein